MAYRNAVNNNTREEVSIAISVLQELPSSPSRDNCISKLIRVLSNMDNVNNYRRVSYDNLLTVQYTENFYRTCYSIVDRICNIYSRYFIEMYTLLSELGIPRDKIALLISMELEIIVSTIKSGAYEKLMDMISEYILRSQTNSSILEMIKNRDREDRHEDSM